MAGCPSRTSRRRCRVREANRAVLADHDHRVGEAVEDRREPVALGGEHAEGLAELLAHRVERAAQVADLVAAAGRQWRVEVAGRHLLRRASQPPHPDRDQRGDHEADQDPDRNRDQQRPEAIAAKLIERPGQRGRWVRPDDHRAPHRHVTVAENRCRGDRDVPGQARAVAAVVEGDAKRLRLVRDGGQAGEVLPRREGVAVPVERPDLEVPGVRQGKDVGGVQLVDLAEVVREAGGLAYGEVPGLALQRAAGGVVDEDVDRRRRDQRDPGECSAEPQSHRNPATRLPAPRAPRGLVGHA